MIKLAFFIVKSLFAESFSINQLRPQEEFLPIEETVDHIIKMLSRDGADKSN